MSAVDTGRLRQLLERLEGHWRRVDSPILRFLRPGLDVETVDAATAVLGLRLPVEARIWYGWHDGARRPEVEDQPVGDDTMGVTSDRPLPLEEAVEEYRSLRELDRQSAQNHPDVRWPDDVWQPSWFPLGAAAGEDRLAVSCDVPDGAPTPVRHWDTADRGLEVAAMSLTEVVATWVWMLDEGLVYWSNGMWRPDTSRYDRDIWRRAAAL